MSRTDGVSLTLAIEITFLIKQRMHHKGLDYRFGMSFSQRCHVGFTSANGIYRMLAIFWCGGEQILLRILMLIVDVLSVSQIA